MPISNSYPSGIPIADADLFVGTKAYNNRTVNYTAQGVADYLNINSKVAIGGQMSFQFTIVPNIPKTIAFDGGGGDNTAFSAITKLIVSAVDASTANITIFLNYLNNSQVLLSEQNQPNFFGHYKIIGYTQIGTSAFYELDLEFIGGNGTIIDKQYYDLVSFVLSTEVPIPTFQEVTDEGNVTTNTITVGGITSGNFVSDGYTVTISDSNDGFYNFNYTPYVGLYVGNGIDSYIGFSLDTSMVFQTTTGYGNLRSDLVTGSWIWQLPDASGTIALISDIPTTSGIPHATASGTDTYTATVPDVIAYNDADAYLIRFTNGNTTGATLNINGLGAIPLYRNNDGPLLGGDILAGGEMLCIYNSTLVEFQVIGISPNSLIAYVTNDDSVTITKGMPVYAFSGTGDRMTVKRAFNTSDATSAQTVGLVLSTSIGVNQKGVIMMQGLLDGLSILPTATWDDGDPVYLGATPGTITNIKPYAPNHLVYLGVVTTASNGAAGRLYVRVQNGYELDELHNVDAHNPNNNDGIFYNSTTQLWEHKNVLAVAAERRNANNSTNNNINYCGIAPADSLESASVWTITRLTITLAGAVTTANAINVKWTDRETTIYT
jgi:hypothetical protein